jgi:hypothetical protein
MSTPEFEQFLARLYTDAGFRVRFLADRRGTCEAARLTDEQTGSLLAIDAEGLALAAKGFEKKRTRHLRS